MAWTVDAPIEVEQVAVGGDQVFLTDGEELIAFG